MKQPPGQPATEDGALTVPGPRRAPGAPVGRDAVRRAVLDAAAELFTTRGVGDVSLREVAERADVKVTLIGRYIGNREQLIDEVLADLSRQVAETAVASPLAQQGFDDDHPMVRWTRMLAYFAVTGRDLAPTAEFDPVKAIATIAMEQYGLDERSARIRAAQIVGSALGWRLFEPYLLEAGGLQDEPLEELHEELTKTHRRLGATKLPSPPDPKPRRRPA